MLMRGKKMVKGLVSIIMPTYNCASFIEETIESIQAQTYVRWELLIVDDCSTDNTKEIAAKYMKTPPVPCRKDAEEGIMGKRSCAFT